METKTDKIKENKDFRMAFRVTAAQKRIIEEKADECGLSVSEYILFRAMNYEPKRRMSDQEIQAYIRQADYRSDLVHAMNIVKGKSREEQLRIFKDEEFLNWWMVAVAKEMRWSIEVQNNLTSKL